MSKIQKSWIFGFLLDYVLELKKSIQSNNPTKIQKSSFYGFMKLNVDWTSNFFDFWSWVWLDVQLSIQSKIQKKVGLS
jgi:hypothetical protein